nr:venom protein [Lampona murina]
MWFRTFLVLLAFTCVVADVEDDLEECASQVDIEGLEQIMELSDEDDLEHTCPPMLAYFECIEGVVKEATGFTIVELRQLMEGTEAEKFFSIYLNIKSLFQDLCDKDSQLYKAYEKHADCFQTIPTDSLEECGEQAETAYETYKEIEDRVQLEAGESPIYDNRQCMTEAYKFACLGAQVHDSCGQEAFELYMQIIRRTTLFRNGICTESQLTAVKTKFHDSLDMSSSQKEVYRLAFDLKKRRK